MQDQVGVVAGEGIGEGTAWKCEGQRKCEEQQGWLVSTEGVNYIQVWTSRPHPGPPSALSPRTPLSPLTQDPSQPPHPGSLVGP